MSELERSTKPSNNRLQRSVTDKVPTSKSHCPAAETGALDRWMYMMSNPS